MTATAWGIAAVERGLVPDALTRSAIRRLCRERLRAEQRSEKSGLSEVLLASLREGPIARVPEKANQQHYELPPEFFSAVLGPHRKYSCCYFETPNATLAEAEAAALRITCERAQLADGQEVLELGCGWGSLSLWMAELYPQSRITAVSNSAPQRRFIEALAAERGLRNLRIVTADINDFDPATLGADAPTFDRVVSVEMFEHMHNYALLMRRIAGWLRPDGRLFVHIFCHRDFAYPFDTAADDDWMGRHFFTGGMMPSERLLGRFDDDLRLIARHAWNGDHYRRTSEAWLANLDARRRTAMPILRQAYGRHEAKLWFHRWRVFFLAVAELFGYADGDEWFVTHQLFARRDAS